MTLNYHFRSKTLPSSFHRLIHLHTVEELTPVSRAISRICFPLTHMDTNMLRSNRLVGWEGHRFILLRTRPWVSWQSADGVKTSGSSALWEKSLLCWEFCTVTYELVMVFHKYRYREEFSSVLVIISIPSLRHSTCSAFVKSSTKTT